jgi:hypothetical protein
MGILTVWCIEPQSQMKIAMLKPKYQQARAFSGGIYHHRPDL